MTQANLSSPEEPEFEEQVVRIYRCATVVKGGRRFSFAALVVVGDRNGRVGVGYGKAPEVPSAVDKGRKIAHKNMTRIRLQNGTLSHRIWGRYGASKVLMLPASEGTGVIAGNSVRAVLELAGVRDALTKSYGSNSPKNLVRATFEALCNLRDRDEVGRLRGVSLAS
jgi:small subunit ribosomal protein S5